MSRLLWGLLVAALMGPPCFGQESTGVTRLPSAGPRIVGAGDILQIESLVEGLKVRRSAVEPDGNLALGPQWGRVNVEGMSILEVEKTIRDHIAPRVADPKLQVTYAGRSSDGSVGQPDASEIIVKLRQFEQDMLEFKAVLRELRSLRPPR